MLKTERRNYYDTLEVEINATQAEIQKSYNRARNAYAEDSVAMYSLMTKDECSVVLNEIEEAYSVLSIPEKRREYDRVRGLVENKSNSEQQISSEDILKQTLTKQETNNNKQESKDISIDDMFSVNEKRNQEKQNFEFQSIEHSNVVTEDNARHQDYLKFDNDTSVKKQSVEVAKFSAINKFLLSYDEDIEFEDKIQNCVEYTGELLKQIREYKNVSIERMADTTKISKTAIKNIESENFDMLPAVVYTRGFLFQYSKFLKINPDLVCSSYMSKYKEYKQSR